MKLIFCRACKDVVRLKFKLNFCECGKSGGKYINELDAVIGGEDCIPLGFDNFSLVQALKKRPKSGLGSGFNAFVIPEECDTVDVVDIETLYRVGAMRKE